MEINDDFIQRLNELNKLYVESKRAIILLENYNPEQKTFIAPLNEMRNALDHVMKMVINKEKSQVVYEQYRGVRSHLRRAGYDAFELLCISYINYIKKSLEVFLAEDISKGFPQYYAEIKPKVHEIQGKTAEYRERKEKIKQQQEEIIDDGTVVVDDNIYQYYFEAYELLENYVKKLDLSLPSIIECKNQRERKEKKDKITFVVGIILAIVGIGLTIYSMIK